MSVVGGKQKTSALSERFAFWHELLPTASRLAALINPTNVSSVQRVSKKLKEAADALGLTVVFFCASNSGEIDAAFAAFARERGHRLTWCEASVSGSDGEGRTGS